MQSGNSFRLLHIYLQAIQCYSSEIQFLAFQSQYEFLVPREILVTSGNVVWSVVKKMAGWE